MALPLANAAHEARYSAVLSNIHPETGWLGRQDSDFCSAPPIGPTAIMRREEWQKIVPRTLHFSRAAICSTSVI
jgi:hypothetical protein